MARPKKIVPPEWKKESGTLIDTDCNFCNHIYKIDSWDSSVKDCPNCKIKSITQDEVSEILDKIKNNKESRKCYASSVNYKQGMRIELTTEDSKNYTEVTCHNIDGLVDKIIEFENGKIFLKEINNKLCAVYAQYINKRR